ncbi:DUF397 domain-containing protein [Streptomyces griseocarneus]|uniref:DUF397 domain-containing protein n=1 Tax=Streptomyces griseocarneus TaxID=51201 RepID=UPI00167DF01C|nr:DUF397 domain-containing protein [Streptomyces griseocarneus]MBZ6477666.1 DUF397 domain-containing protein [Streptomyces griseocarneus]GHG82030.1 DUF397 domain-containing protein [Streptomyces griseocarneus]
MSARLTWFKSSYSDQVGGDCVEIAALPQAIHIRDSKLELRERGPRLNVPPKTWGTFIAELRASSAERPL